MAKMSAFIGLGTGCFFIFIGIFIGATKPDMFKTQQTAILFGVAVALYGLFRVYRAYKWIKSQ
jgi:hypothetical protein